MAQVRITIERTEEVWQKSRDWRRVTDRQDVKQFDYVDAELPKVETTTLLHQVLPDDKLDLAAVIKAVNGL